MPSKTNCLAALTIAALALAASPSLPAASPSLSKVACGTPHRAQETLFLHQQRMLRKPGLTRLAQAAPTVVRNIGEIAVIEATPDTVAPANPLDLSRKRITITPGASTFAIESTSIDAETPIAEQGTVLDLDDDDFSPIELPFAFPYYGEQYTRLFVQSDGNLTFLVPEASSTARSYSRLAGGPPNIAPFFRDLDPSRGGRVQLALQGDRLVVTWYQVPEFVEVGVGSPQTFQVALDANGVVEFLYGAVDATDAVVGLFPGDLARQAKAVDWSAADAMSFDNSQILAEVFRSERAVDEFAVIHAFFRSHEDAYDSLIVFNDLDFDASQFSLAHAYTVRNQVEGIGEYRFDYGRFFGSPERLSAFVNMGAVSDYPASPLAPIPGLPHASMLTILAHEVGHRFLAYAAFRDPESGEISLDLLGRQLAHWSFFFNSQASVLEGNAIRDHGPEATPRFETVAATQTYGPVDQYLMGLIEASEVPATFLVKNPTSTGRLGSAARSPEVGVTFDGVRQEVRIEDIIAAVGNRKPGASISQRHFRHAFALLVEDADSPDTEAIALLQRLRAIWLAFFEAQLGSKATAAADLVRMLHLSTWPAGGLIEQSAGQGRVTISEPRQTDLVVNLSVRDSIATVPLTVTIAAGEVQAEFAMHGLEAGSTTLVAEAGEAGYDRSVTRLSVREGVPGLVLQALHPAEVHGVAGSLLPVPLRYRVVDENLVPYSGVEVLYVATGDDAASILPSRTDHNGEVSIRWPLAASPAKQLLTARLRGAPEAIAHTTATTALGQPTFDASGAVNAASQEVACPSPVPVAGSSTPAITGGPSSPCTGRGFAPGSLVTIQGSSLASKTQSADTLLLFGNPSLPFALGGTRVHVDGIAAPLVHVSPEQVTFQVPFEVQGPSIQVLVATLYGRSEPVTLPVGSAQPGIFPDRVSGGVRAAVVGSKPDSGLLPQAGGLLELFCTGLGVVSPPGRTGRPGLSQPMQRVVAETEAWVDDQVVKVTLSALVSFEAGVYVVLLDLPDDLNPGEHSVKIAVGGMESNAVPFKSE